MTHKRRQKPRRKEPLNATETVRIIARLFDRYGLDRSPGRDRSEDGWRFKNALYCAARDRLLKVPKKKRGPSSQWKGARGLELLAAVEQLRLKKPNVTAAIEALQKQDPDKWGGSLDQLVKHYYEAKRFHGGLGTLLARAFFPPDPWRE